MTLSIKDEIRAATEYFRRYAEERNAVLTSHLYVILDYGGGWRFVVTPPYDIKNHPIAGESVIEVPDIRISEPVSEDITYQLLRLASRYATLQLAQENACGGCTVCCVNMPIGIRPVVGVCQDIDHDCVGGCAEYPVRPQPCKDFECEWLKSQRVNDRMSPELRPDRCGAMFVQNVFDPDLIEVHHYILRAEEETDNVKEHIQILEQYGKRIVRV